MSLSQPLDHSSIASLCQMHKSKHQCHEAHKLFFEYAHKITKETGVHTSFNPNRKVLGFHVTLAVPDGAQGSRLVRCANHNCNSLGIFEMEEIYIINAPNGSFRLMVAKQSAGAIASFAIMMVVLAILLVLLIVWGVQGSKKSHKTSNDHVRTVKFHPQ